MIKEHVVYGPDTGGGGNSGSIVRTDFDIDPSKEYCLIPAIFIGKNHPNRFNRQDRYQNILILILLAE